MSDPGRLVEQYIAAWNSGDVEATIPFLDPQIEIDWSESHAPWAGTYTGLASARQLYAQMRDGFEAIWGEIHEYVVSGNRVAVPNTAHTRGRDGIEVVARSTILFTTEGDRVTAVRLFQGRADALAALES